MATSVVLGKPHVLGVFVGKFDRTTYFFKSAAVLG